MRISFDVDETLVCRQTDAPTEVGRLPSVIHRWLGEPLRHGTRSLVHQLRQRGCSIWIYTSSGRTAFHIRLWLLLHGIRVDGVVNEERHRRELSGRRFSRLPSKYPPAFGIDLHVDDSEGVRMFVMFGIAGGLILSVAFRALRTGFISAKRARYERSVSPFGFWFYVSFYGLIGTVIAGYAVYCLLRPEFARE
jgi:hypothetical protein